MSRWVNNLASQNLNNQLRTAITKLEGVDISGIPQNTLSEYNRLLKAIRIIEVKLTKIDPELYHVNTWGNFGSWVNTIQNNADHFASSKNIGHLHNANSAADEILNVIKPLDIGTTVEEFKSIAEANHIVQQKLNEEITKAKTKNSEISAQTEAFSKALEASKQQLSNNDKAIEQQKTRIDSLISEYQKQFSQSQDQRSKDFIESQKEFLASFTSKLEAFETEFKKTSKSNQETFDSIAANLKIETEKHVAFMKEREEKTNEIFGAIGSTAFAGNFKTTADNEGGDANTWRRIAIGFMAVMVITAGVAFYYSISHETDWHAFLFRFGTVAILAIPAAYAANESSKHRERERLNRKFHLELASIDAYLVLLPAEQKNKIKGDLAEKFFGQPALKDEEAKVSQKDMFGVISTVVSNLTKGK